LSKCLKLQSQSQRWPPVGFHSFARMRNLHAKAIFSLTSRHSFEITPILAPASPDRAIAGHGKGFVLSRFPLSLQPYRSSRITHATPVFLLQ
jgi:hypothetical protein